MASGQFRHNGILPPPPELPSFPLLSAFEALVLSGAGYPYYRRALALLVQREYDLSVLIAGMSWVGFLAGARWLKWVAARSLDGGRGRCCRRPWH